MGDLFRVVVLDVEENLVVNKGELLYKGELPVIDIVTTNPVFGEALLSKVPVPWYMSVPNVMSWLTV